MFFLVMVRLAGFFTTAPVFNSKLISTRVKTALIFWLTLIIMFVIPIPKNIPEFSSYFIIYLIHGFLFGALIGAIANFIFSGVQFAGSLMDMQMGLSVAQTFDPMVGAQVTIMERLMQFLCLLIFINLRGHHILLGGIYESFRMFPVTSMINLENSYISIIELCKLLFYIGVQISAPIVLVIFLLDFSFGIISRVAPQVNVFQLGFQVKPVLGGLIFILLLPLMIDRITAYLLPINDHILKLFALLQSG